MNFFLLQHLELLLLQLFYKLLPSVFEKNITFWPKLIAANCSVSRHKKCWIIR